MGWKEQEEHYNNRISRASEKDCRAPQISFNKRKDIQEGLNLEYKAQKRVFLLQF